jgi:hypothetical protein
MSKMADVKVVIPSQSQLGSKQKDAQYDVALESGKQAPFLNDF